MLPWREPRCRTAAVALAMAVALQSAAAVRPVELSSREEALLRQRNATELHQLGQARLVGLSHGSRAVEDAAEIASQKAHEVAEQLDTYHSAVHKMAKAISTVKDAALHLKAAYLSEFASGEDARLAPLMLQDHFAPKAPEPQQDISDAGLLPAEEGDTSIEPDEDEEEEEEDDKDIDYSGFFGTPDGARTVAENIRRLNEMKHDEDKIDGEIEKIVQGKSAHEAEKAEIPHLAAERDNITRQEKIVREEILNASKAVPGTPPPVKEHIAPSSTTLKELALDTDTLQEENVLRELKEQEKSVEEEIDSHVGEGGANDTETVSIPELVDERNAIIKKEDEVREEIMNPSMAAPSTTLKSMEVDKEIGSEEHELKELKDEEMKVEAEIDSATNETEPLKIRELMDERNAIIKKEDEVRQEIMNVSVTVQSTAPPVKEHTAIPTATLHGMEEDAEIKSDSQLLRQLEDKEEEVQTKIDNLVQDGTTNQTDAISELVDERSSIIKEEDEVRAQMMNASKAVVSTAPPRKATLRASTAEEAVDKTAEIDNEHMEVLKDEQAEVESKIEKIIEAPGSNDTKMDDILALEHQRQQLVTDEERLQENMALHNRTSTEEALREQSLPKDASSTAAPVDPEEALDIAEDATLLNDLKDQETEIETELADISEGPGDNATKMEQLIELEDERHEILKEEDELREEMGTASRPALGASSDSTTNVSIETKPTVGANAALESHKKPELQEETAKMQELRDKEKEERELEESIGNSTGEEDVTAAPSNGVDRELDVEVSNKTVAGLNTHNSSKVETIEEFHHLQASKAHVMKHELDSIAAAEGDAEKVREIDAEEEQLVVPNASNSGLPDAIQQEVKELREIHAEEQSVVDDAPIHATKGFSDAPRSQHQEENQIHDIEGTDIKQEDEVVQDIMDAGDEALNDSDVETPLVTTSVLDVAETTMEDDADFDSD